MIRLSDRRGKPETDKVLRQKAEKARGIAVHKSAPRRLKRPSGKAS